MLKALSSGASGLNAQQVKVDVIGNNLANVNTTGFKRSRSEFLELVGQEVARHGLPVSRDAADIKSGSGVGVDRVARIFEPGEMIETGRPLDLAIQGEGFFKVLMAGGGEGYTRDGSFNADQQGNLVTSSGHRLEGIELPPGYDRVSVASDGKVTVEKSGSVTEAGQIMLHRFANPEGLTAGGGNIFLINQAAGETSSGNPGSREFGAVRQGALELSNVNLVEELTSLIEAQRAYGFSAKVVRTADEMWGMANNMRK